MDTADNYFLFMAKINYLENTVEFSLFNEVFEKLGVRRLISRGVYFARSG